ncbi:hypothetical protein PoB_002203800 [Plakobranchus ocellatus]|uniref:Uncharacterized protein n=1 Tax=Plakobranchus ocellatus TaxID=259542 RepID=A0AAV3ZLR6_9GAST|nr:hypothetical protein PoB_002203800 [Plakobranchus ocellatus]
MTSELLLYLPDIDTKFVLRRHASDLGLDAALIQKKSGFQYVNKEDRLFDTDGQCCLPQGRYPGMAFGINDEEREASELSICRDLPFAKSM